MECHGKLPTSSAGDPDEDDEQRPIWSSRPGNELPDLPVDWTPIAVRPRNPVQGADLVWSTLPGAPLDPRQAHDLLADNVLVMASRHMPDRVLLVVRRRRGS